MHLKSLVLDFENCYCASGCCRLFEFLFNQRIFDRCHHYWPGRGGSELESVEVFGLLNKEELEQVRAMGWIGEHPTEKKRAWRKSNTHVILDPFRFIRYAYNGRRHPVFRGVISWPTEKGSRSSAGTKGFK